MISLKIAANICGGLLVFLGLLVKLAPRTEDQLFGNAAIGLALLGLLVANLASGKTATGAQWALCLPLILFFGYLVFRRAF